MGHAGGEAVSKWRRFEKAWDWCYAWLDNDAVVFLVAGALVFLAAAVFG